MQFPSRQAIIRWILIAFTVLSWIVALFWFIDQPGFEPLLTVLSGLAALAAALFMRDESAAVEAAGGPLAVGRAGAAPAAGENIVQRVARLVSGDSDLQHALRNRARMLQLVEKIWVDGVLKKSLFNEALIELGMQAQAGAIERPLDRLVRLPDQEERPLPPSTSMLEVFDQMKGAMLILGEPGSGKTTMLLELARGLIERARGELAEFARQAPLQPELLRPIPVVFNLSSWRDLRQPLSEWLVDELNSIYSIPTSVARAWVKNGDLLLLLDGLDEVAADHRQVCIQAINACRKETGVDLAVCSRLEEYEALPERLQLWGAVRLLPLTRAQIEAFFQSAQLAAMQQVLAGDAELQELVKSPLMLNIIVMAYHGLEAADLQSAAESEARRRRLFDAYVEQMFLRRRSDPSYSPQQTKHWLAWLAKEMGEHGLAVFQLEKMGPGWLASEELRRLHRLRVSLLAGLLSGLTTGLLVGVSAAWLFSSLRYGLAVGLITGLFVGLFVGLPDWRTFTPVEALNWSSSRLRKGLLIGPLVGLVVGSAAGLAIGLFYQLTFTRPFMGMLEGTLFGLSLGLLGGLLVGLLSGLRSAEVETRASPNQGYRRSLRNALSTGLLVFLISGLSLGLVSRQFLTHTGGAFLGVFGGWFLGLLVGLGYGGMFVFSQLCLRQLLFRQGCMPWDYVTFLDFTTERIFLRKVGGGYMFIHRLLMEHFAEMEQEWGEIGRKTGVA
ncbi:MAG: NACHT domain-containing protein [Anaerolineales bacterium]|nr:NACHT domain-containing protein [Anaerolineales bacterium]